MTPKAMIVPAAEAGPAGSATSALARVANRPLVCHVLKELSRAGVREAAFVVSAREHATIRACIEHEGPVGVAVRYHPHQPGEGLHGALVAAAEWVGAASCIVHVSNGLLTQPLGELVERLRTDSPDMVALVHQPHTTAASIELAAHRLLRVTEGPAPASTLDLAGACLFGPGALRRAAHVCWCQSGELDLAAIAKLLVDTGGSVQVERVSGWRSYTGEVDDLLELNRLVLDALALEPVSANGTGNRIEGRVEVHPSACVRSSVIVGPAVVDAGALVLDSYIGPYTAIGADVRVEGAEIERSVILPGASITHVGRLDGSVVGRDARIFRDFSLPRALRLHVGDGGKVALC